MSTWNAAAISYFGIFNNNLDRDSNNNAYVRSNIITRSSGMVDYRINNQ